MTRLERLQRGPLKLAAFTTVTLGTLGIAYWQAFSVYSFSDDEGSHLETMRALLNGGALYSDVYAYHGPFHFELMALLYRFDPSVATSDNARFAVIAIWTLSALAAGLAVRRLTDSTLLGIAAQIAWFSAARNIDSEPGHPLSSVVLLLAVAGCAIAYWMPRAPRRAMTTLGLVAGALVATKVNVGGLFVISVAFAAALTLPALRGFRRPAVVVVLVPFALMARDLGTDAWRIFAIVVAGAVAAILVAARGADDADDREAGWDLLARFSIGTAAALGAAIFGVALFGSNVIDVVDGIFITPASHPDVNSFALPIERKTMTWTVAAVALAVLTASAVRDGRLSARWSGGIRLVAGVLTWAAVAGVQGLAPEGADVLLVVPALLAWVAALPLTARTAGTVEQFVRVAVPSIAVLQVLHAYPVAASQRSPGAVFFVFAGALCIRDGLEELGAALELQWRRLFAASAASAMVLVVLLQGLYVSSHNYHQNSALPFPGATRIRLAERDTAALTGIASLLKRACDAFVGLPGYYSLNAWTGIPPVDNLIVNQWMPLLDEKQQQHTVDALFRHERPCAVRSKYQLDRWQQGKPVPPLPLARTINAMTPVATSGPFELMVPATRVKAVRQQLGG